MATKLIRLSVTFAAMLLLVNHSLSLVAANSVPDPRGSCIEEMATYLKKYSPTTVQELQEGKDAEVIKNNEDNKEGPDMPVSITKLLTEVRSRFDENVDLMTVIYDDQSDIVPILKEVTKELNDNYPTYEEDCNNVLTYVEKVVSVQCCGEQDLSVDESVLNEMSHRKDGSQDLIHAAALCAVQLPEDELNFDEELNFPDLEGIEDDDDEDDDSEDEDVEIEHKA